MGVRNHGFERPLDSRQVASWVVFAVFMAFFFVLYAVVHTGAVGITLTVLYALTAVAGAFSGWRAMRIDPSDEGALAKRSGVVPVAPPSSAERKNYCYHCEAYVNVRSKHCRRCNKCVEAFDHHCPWLNTCVGAYNYTYFIALLVSLSCLTAIQMATAIQSAVLHSDEANNKELNDRLGIGATAYVILLCLCAFACFVVWLSLMQLFTFHIGLMSRGMTTYEFIIAQRQKQKAFAQTRGTAPLTWGEKRQLWVQNNAPCFAVCDMCDVSPPAGTTTREKAAIQITGSAKRQPGGFLRMRGSRSQYAGKETVRVRSPDDECAPCSPSSLNNHATESGGRAVANDASSNDVPKDVCAEPSAVYISDAPDVHQDGALEAACAQTSAHPSMAAQDQVELPRGRIQLEPLDSQPAMPNQACPANGVSRSESS